MFQTIQKTQKMSDIFALEHVFQTSSKCSTERSQTNGNYAATVSAGVRMLHSICDIKILYLYHHSLYQYHKINVLSRISAQKGRTI